MRASIEVENLGYPTVSLVCSGFASQGKAIAASSGVSDLPLAAYPGQINLHTAEELIKNVEAVLVDQVLAGLTVQPGEVRQPVQSDPRGIVFSGQFDGVNRFFYEKGWSDGLPIVPPTMESVAEFLKYTERQDDEVIGVLLPEQREATPKNIAINGVMAGCRPEYLPVLIAIVEAMLEPKFGQEHLGHTPGTEVLITLNGPIIKQLGFNYEQGALRDGFQANTSIGRFWRLFLRNVAGILPHETDKATFGGTWRVVLAENEDAVAEMGWQPMSVDRGFKEGENVITITSCTCADSAFAMGADTAVGILNKLAARIVDVNLRLFGLYWHGPGVKPQIILSPCIAEAIARGGFSKEGMRQYLYEHAVFPAKRFESVFYHHGTLCDAVRLGKLPVRYGESEDPNRLVPITGSPDDFMITISGDSARDNCFICGQNGFIGYPASKKVKLPLNWEGLLKEAGEV